MKTMQGERLRSDLQRLVQAPNGERKSLKPVEPKGRLEARKGRGDWHEDEQPQGGGVASPLVEENYNTRERWAERTFSSVDGLLSFRYRPIRSTHQVDANNAEVVNQWAEPSQ